IHYRVLSLSLLLGLSSLTQARDVDHKWCPPEQAAPVAAQTDRINLAADALFQFNQSAAQDILPQGLRHWTHWPKHYSHYVRVDGIHITGHTDRLGSDTYNQALGQRRAETVKGYLADKGVHAPMSVASAGEREPVTTNCVGSRATAALKACLQPDRRVVVDVTGVKK
ncbi:OmpA family protein, partial [Snodgrassella sp. CFCC 13594]|uniref:OmpA family protein n=1 Tax=Snodgrassella sp. CFCC 13594 TaxID=1775559 RepID=UPI000A677D91